MRSAPTRLRTAVGVPLCALLGFAVGGLATFKAPAGAAAGLPYGLVVGLVLVPVLVLALRLGVGGRRFGAAGAVGLLVAAVVLALPSAGGSVVLPIDPGDPLRALGFVWLIGVAVLGATAAAVPLPAPRTGVGADGILVDDEGTRS